MKAGQETDSRDSESMSNAVAGGRGGINKGAIARTFQDALHQSETGHEQCAAKGRSLTFNDFCCATRHAIRLCVYGPHYRAKRGAKRKKEGRASDGEKFGNLAAGNTLGVDAAKVGLAKVPVLELRAATARPPAETEVGVGGEKSGDAKSREPSIEPTKLGNESEPHGTCCWHCAKMTRLNPVERLID